MENITNTNREENRRIVQDGLDRRAEARANDEREARMEAFERTMINGCNENSASRWAQHMAAQSVKDDSAVMEDPKATAAREKAAAWKRVKDSFNLLAYFATFLRVLRYAEDFGAPATATIHLAVIAAVMAIAGIITLNRPAFRSWRKRRAVR